MKRAAAVFLVLFACASRPDAQEPPPPIPLFVVDLHAVLPNFPSDLQQLADSRGLQLAELPGRGFGGDLGVHLYPLRWRQVTFGIGGSATLSRAHSAGVATAGLRPVTEHFTSIAPQLSFNFGTGSGWSYISGGISGATWSIVPDGLDPLPPDQQRLKTINYGGGARWFIKPHLAFSFDVRFYAIDPSAPAGNHPNGPRTTLLVVGAGISTK
jgi:hypothetical protein